MKNNLEFSDLSTLLKSLPRSKLQKNRLFESDCEILKMPWGFLTLSTDSIGEEIDIGLYQDPELWGWMTVMVSVSDLAASGSQALGLLLTNQWKYGTSEKTKLRYLTGVKKALLAADLPLLGGDSGSGASHCHSSTIIGHSKAKPLTRLGLSPGDYVGLIKTQPTGAGPALAYQFLFQDSPQNFSENLFRPTPQPKLLKKIRPLVKASIDTSDGLATSLQILRELNQVGFELNWDPKIMSPEGLQFCAKKNLHPLILWMGDHGDYETLVIIPKAKIETARELCKNLSVLGKVVSYKKGVQVKMDSRVYTLPVELVTTCPRDTSSLMSVTLEVNKLLSSQSSPTRLAKTPAQRMRPKTRGDEK